MGLGSCFFRVRGEYERTLGGQANCREQKRKEGRERERERRVCVLLPTAFCFSKRFSFREGFKKKEDEGLISETDEKVSISLLTDLALFTN